MRTYGRSVHTVVGALCAATTALAPRAAHGDLLSALIPDVREHPAGALLVTMIIADVYMVGSGIRYSIRAERPDRTWATVETIITAPQTALGLIGTFADPGPEFLALTGVVGSLTAYGVTTLVQHRGTAVRRVTPIESALPLLAIDLPFALVDVALAARGQRIGRIGGTFEMLIAAPQVAYGIYAAASYPSDRWMVLAMTSLPLALLAHGAVECARGSEVARATATAPVIATETPRLTGLSPALSCRDAQCRDFDTTVALTGLW